MSTKAKPSNKGKVLIPDRAPARKRTTKINFYSVPAEVVERGYNSIIDIIFFLLSKICKILGVKIKISKNSDALKQGEIYSCDINLLKKATQELWNKLTASQVTQNGIL